MAARQTRKEKQAATRSLLMKAAAKVCAKRGLQRTSIDEVAEEAGYTKGAFYSNFASKEELFLAMLDERFEQRVRDIDAAIGSTDDPEAAARRAGDDFTRFLAADPEWQRLFFEFAAHAARNPEFREELVTRYRTLRSRIAELLRTRAEELGFEPPIPFDQIALMLFAMGNGFAMERLLEPDVVPDDLHGSMMSFFLAGLQASMPSASSA